MIYKHYAEIRNLIQIQRLFETLLTGSSKSEAASREPKFSRFISYSFNRSFLKHIS